MFRKRSMVKIRIAMLLLVAVLFNNFMIVASAGSATDKVTLTFSEDAEQVYTALWDDFIRQEIGEEVVFDHANRSISMSKETADSVTHLTLYIELFIPLSPEESKEVLVELNKFEKLQFLELFKPGLTELTGIDKFANLNQLRLLGSEYIENADLDALGNVSTLESLVLDAEKVTDVSSLSNLSNLKSLELQGTSVTDFNNVTGLTGLEYLDLSKYDSNLDKMTDTSSLEGFVGLKELKLDNNAITSISDFSKLTNLEKLQIDGNELEDISGLKELTSLNFLTLRENKIMDVASLGSLVQLTDLTLHKNEIEDISSLEGLTQLTNLNLEENKVSDISSLESLTQLTNLTLEENKVSDISSLGNLTELNWLNLRENNVGDFSVVDSLSKLSVYQLSGQEITLKTNQRENIVLPPIFEQAFDVDSKAYVGEDGKITSTGCTVDKSNYTANFEDGKNEATIYLNHMGGYTNVSNSVVYLIYDDVKPVITLSYSTTTPTADSVIVTMTSDKEVQEIEGWIRSADKRVLTKEYLANSTEQVKVLDLIGNECIVDVKVENIDKEGPILSVMMNPYLETNGTVDVTIESNEEVQTIEGWALSEDKKVLTREYTSNVKEQVKVLDVLGNESVYDLVVDQIVNTPFSVQLGDTSSLFTKEEIESGLSRSVRLVVRQLQEADVAVDEKNAVDSFVQKSAEKLNTYMYLDLALIKTIENEEMELTELQTPVRFTIELPQELIDLGKQIVLLRVHDGKVTQLIDLDSDPNTGTFETDQFSTYVLSSTDEIINSGPNTGDTNNILWWVIICMITGGMVLLLLRRRYNQN